MYNLNPEDKTFFDSSKLLSEFIRQASICHGCRLCFNYCFAFPKLFKLTDEKGPKNLTLDDLEEITKECFHCKMCYNNCPYTPPHEFAMDFADLMDWAWLYFRSQKPLTLRDFLFELVDGTNLARPLVSKLYPHTRRLLGISEDAPMPLVKEKGFLREVKPKRIEKPIAKVVLFHTCLVENFYPELGFDLIEVFNKLGIEVVTANFLCCGAPMLDVGDAKRLKKNAEYNYSLMRKFIEQGYDIVSPIPTCTLMLSKEYPLILQKEGIKVYDAMEYLLKLDREGKIKISGKLEKSIFYHPPCHLKYLKVGYAGVNIMRKLGAKVEISDKGCSGIDGGWGLRNYEKARVVGSKMMNAFAESKADIFMTECPLAGLQIQKASKRQPLHPIQILKEVLSNG
ncbi:glycerol-3-phosphate dehydrogenase [Sulfolobus sp. S-194]|uniref:heterodisulfide reductase-related iron-sulfur binding cluster n=1 Tax=Sulfolobus sp. S-194 TaxID=2512240 RepID=UPI0014373631|nr:heterodisulfide reductase-related iron-sulfur binding cluster [Sulfolobus sp. S-194]QIW25149.1 glycerol-3-phosphate dehydrogenase [Sulfolobus sp. S-194]